MTEPASPNRERVVTAVSAAIMVALAAPIVAFGLGVAVLLYRWMVHG